MNLPSYLIMNLNASGMIARIDGLVTDPDTGNVYPDYIYDFSKLGVMRGIVLSEELYNSNAAFDQIVFELLESGSISAEQRFDHDLLRERLVYVDFSGVKLRKENSDSSANRDYDDEEQDVDAEAQDVDDEEQDVDTEGLDADDEPDADTEEADTDGEGQDDDMNRDSGNENPDDLSDQIPDPSTLSEDAWENASERRKSEVLFRHGFRIVFPDGKTVRFVPFDKSSSMTKKSKISFIDASLLKALNKRLNIGIYNENTSVPLYKYYSYRGLYFSDASRIDVRYENGEHRRTLVLNQRTVIVMADPKVTRTKPVRVITAKRVPDSKAEPVSSEEGSAETGSDIPARAKWECYETTDDHFESQPFDGEGIISPLYADLINEQLFGSGSAGSLRRAESFQIRMPFAKGMLHTVAFHDFMNDVLPDSFQTGKKNRPLYVRDTFGILRDLNEAEIILTTGMFKCFKTLQKYCEKSGIDDPMAYYFGNLRKYRHSLYIAGTDEKKGEDRVPFNYQLLNPLCILPEELKSIENAHLDELHNVYSKNPAARDRILGKTPSKNTDMNDDGETDQPAPVRFSSTGWKAALRANLNFINDSAVVTVRKSITEGMIRDIGLGHFLVRGTDKLLSRDLLAFLIQLMRQMVLNPAPDKPLKIAAGPSGTILLHDPDPDERKKIQQRDSLLHDFIDHLKKTSLREHQFFMADQRIGLSPQRTYAFFRNPHLSRAEEFAARPHIVRKPEDTALSWDLVDRSDKKTILRNESDYLYTRYFSHLTGIVQVSYESLAPEILGGADFDGDHVKVIAQEEIVRSVLRGNYAFEKVPGSDKPVLSRVTGIVKIPDDAGQFPEPPAETLKAAETADETGKITEINTEPETARKPRDAAALHKSQNGKNRSSVDALISETPDFNVIADTFSNRIGLISNAAISIGRKQYVPDAGMTKITGKEENTREKVERRNLEEIESLSRFLAENDPARSKKKTSGKANTPDGSDHDESPAPDSESTAVTTCEMCTILTGLEIDAAKKGAHPDIKGALETSRILRSADPMTKGNSSYREKDYYIAKKDEIKGLGHLSCYSVSKETKKNKPAALTAKDHYGHGLTAFEPPCVVPGPAVDHLPYEFLLTLRDYKKKAGVFKKPERKSKEPPVRPMTLFRKDPDLVPLSSSEKAAAEERKKRLITVFNTYHAVITKTSDLYKLRQNFRRSNYYSYILNILRMQYDSDDLFEIRSVSGDLVYTDAQKAFEEVYQQLFLFFKTPAQIQDASDAVYSAGWQFTDKDRRADLLFGPDGILRTLDADDTDRALILAFLTNFSNSGFNLLYDLLADLFSVRSAHISMEEFSELQEPEDADDSEKAASEGPDADVSEKDSSEKTDAAASGKNLSDRTDADVPGKDSSKKPDTGPDLYQRLMKIYIEADKTGKTKRIWEDQMLRELRAEVFAIFAPGKKEEELTEDRISEIISECASIRSKADPNGKVFWGIFTDRELTAPLA